MKRYSTLECKWLWGKGRISHYVCPHYRFKNLLLCSFLPDDPAGRLEVVEEVKRCSSSREVEEEMDEQMSGGQLQQCEGD